jgi:sugar-specific transcriptional regulator TrmB
MDTDALEELGLTRNEAIIYITLLDTGKANIGQITEKTRMHRRTIYDCLERLQDRGLASHVVEKKIRFFSAVNPQKLREIVKEKEVKVENILPSLLKIANSSKSATEVTVHKSKEGLKSVMQDLLRTKPKAWYSLTSGGKGTEVLPFYIPQFHEKRIQEKIFLKLISDKNPSAIKRSKELKKLRMTEVRLLDTKYFVPISLWVYSSKTAFMLWESEIGILIENKETAETFRNYFEFLWRKAKA